MVFAHVMFNKTFCVHTNCTQKVLLFGGRRWELFLPTLIIQIFREIRGQEKTGGIQYSKDREINWKICRKLSRKKKAK